MTRTSHFTTKQFSSAVATLALAAASTGVWAQTAPPGTAVTAPEAVHVICIAEVISALDVPLLLNDPELTAKFGELIEFRKGKFTINVANTPRYVAESRKYVWPLQGLWAKSLGTGFVVGKDQRSVLTSYDIATSCPLISSTDRKIRTQIAILSADGLRPIKGVALGISQKFSEASTEKTPLPKFICSRLEDALCNSSKAEDLHKDQLNNGLGLARLRSEVKYWYPDLAVISLDEPATAKPVEFRASDKIDSGMSLRYSGFPQSMQQGGQGTSNAVVPAVRATPAVQPATFSRVVTIDNSADQIVSPERRVVATWLEVSGASIERGNGGAPLYDPATGQVIGLVIKDLGSKASQGGGKAVPAGQILKYLEQAKVDVNIAKVIMPQAAPTPVPAVSPAPVPAAETNRWVEILKSPRSLAIAGLLTVFVGIVAFLIWRQRQPETKPVDALGMSGTGTIGRPSLGTKTKPQYFATLRCAQSPLAPTELLIPTLSGSDSLTVGKDPSVCQIVFPESSEQISGLHCRFGYDKEAHTLHVEDMQSTNGTFVNKRQLRKGERVRLNNNDVVALARPDSNLFIVTLN